MFQNRYKKTNDSVTVPATREQATSPIKIAAAKTNIIRFNLDNKGKG
jgi:hypothetical protein